MPAITVLGDTLPGLAAAARLASVGHRVTLIPDADAAAPTVPGLVDLPAAWRDLFAKTGRPLKGTLGVRGLELTAVDAEFVRLPDGSDLAWPSDRGAQWHTLDAAFGTPAATAWRDFVDALDHVWQALRDLGLEDDAPAGPLPPALDHRRTAADAAATLPHPALTYLALRPLAELGLDPAHTPAWHLAILSVQRTFGRWQLTDADGVRHPNETLIDALRERVASLCHHAAQAPETDLTIDARPDVTAPAWRKPGRFGLGSASYPQQLRARTRAPRMARPHSGPLDAPWADLLTGALAAYEAHLTLTGEQLHPARSKPR